MEGTGLPAVRTPGVAAAAGATSAGTRTAKQLLASETWLCVALVSYFLSLLTSAVQAAAAQMQSCPLHASACCCCCCRCRKRQYKILTPAGAYVPSSMPGMADVTFKMKLVDPDTAPGELQLQQQVRIGLTVWLIRDNCRWFQGPHTQLHSCP